MVECNRLYHPDINVFTFYREKNPMSFYFRFIFIEESSASLSRLSLAYLLRSVGSTLCRVSRRRFVFAVVAIPLAMWMARVALSSVGVGDSRVKIRRPRAGKVAVSLGLVDQPCYISLMARVRI
jgi:hypothetical protein